MDATSPLSSTTRQCVGVGHAMELGSPCASSTVAGVDQTGSPVADGPDDAGGAEPADDDAIVHPTTTNAATETVASDEPTSDRRRARRPLADGGAVRTYLPPALAKHAEIALAVAVPKNPP